MKDNVTFYTNPMSRGRMVHWMLEETGAPYDVKLVDFKRNEHKAPAYLAINPMGKVPAIVHRGTVVTESAAIIAYLADAFPAAHLAPPVDSPTRGSYYRWLFFGAGCFEPAIMDKMTNRPACERPTALGYGTYEDTMRTLESALKGGQFLLGDQFSAVDVYIASQIGFGAMTKAIEPNPVFMAYAERCRQRPGFKRSEEKTKELEKKISSNS